MCPAPFCSDNTMETQVSPDCWYARSTATRCRQWLEWSSWMQSRMHRLAPASMLVMSALLPVLVIVGQLCSNPGDVGCSHTECEHSCMLVSSASLLSHFLDLLQPQEWSDTTRVKLSPEHATTRSQTSHPACVQTLAKFASGQIELGLCTV